jgi:hypothetical protein
MAWHNQEKNNISPTGTGELIKLLGKTTNWGAVTVYGQPERGLLVADVASIGSFQRSSR